MKTIALFITILLAACVEDPKAGPPPVAGGYCPISGVFCEDTCGLDCFGDTEDSGSSDDAPERQHDEPAAELPIDADIDPFAVQFDPDYLGGVPKCCPSGADNFCVSQVSGSCSGTGKLTTVCKGCDFESNDFCSTSFQANPWIVTGFVGGVPQYMCTGLSIKTNGSMLVDRCSSEGCVPSVDDENETMCTQDFVAGLGCSGTYGSAQTPAFDGAIGRMCCRANGSSPTGYTCIPRGADQSCSGLGAHSSSAYCVPCDYAFGVRDPDGTLQPNNNEGAWDLYGPSAASEWVQSAMCGADSSYVESELPSPFDVCQKVEYVCRGVQVNASSGAEQYNNCP